MTSPQINAFIQQVYDTLKLYNIPARAMIYCCLLDPVRLKNTEGTEIEFYATIPGGYNATLYARPLGTTKWIKIYRIRPSTNLNLASIVEQNGEGRGSEYTGGETEN